MPATPTSRIVGAPSGGTIAGGRSVTPAIGIAAAGLAPGQVLTITQATLNTNGANGTLPFDKTGVAGSLNLLDWANKMVWDVERKRAYVAGGRPYSDPASQKLVVFDAKNDLWLSVIDPFAGGTGGHLYDGTAYASQHDIVLRVPYGNAVINTWDAVAGTAGASIPAAPTSGYGGWNAVTTICWHPNLGSQGSLIWGNLTRKRIMRFDWATQTWSEIKLDGVSSADQHWVSCYLPAADVVVMGGSYNYGTSPYGAFNVISNTGVWSSTPPCPVQISCNGSAAGRGPLVSHPNGQGAIAFSMDDGHMWHWVAATNTWHDRGATPAGFNNVGAIACTLHEYGVIMLAASSSSAAPYSCKIYKPDY